MDTNDDHRDPPRFAPTIDPAGNLPQTDDGSHAVSEGRIHGVPAAGDGVTQEAADSADQPDVDDTHEG